MFDHYIITRFNLRNPNWEAKNGGKPLLTDTWMDNRFRLFENFCLPTVLSQTNQNFTWLLYFDISTAEKHKKHILKLVNNATNIKVFFIDGMPVFYNNIQHYIAENSNDKKYIISTRIDNDDSIHKDFVKRIQEQFHFQKREVIDLLKGYSLQIKPEIILGKKDHIFNPFISLIEENKNPKTVWSNSHNTWKIEKNVTFIKDERLWMVVIHQNNKTNNFNGYGNVSWEKIKHNFVISPTMSETLLTNTIDYKQWKKLSIKNRIIVKYKVLSKLFKRNLGLYRVKK